MCNFMEKKWWINIKKMNNDINVLPVGDIKSHIEDATCPCNPRIEVIRANLLIVHHAWDNRELFEEIDAAIKDGSLMK